MSRKNDPIYIVTYYIKLVNTFWTDSTHGCKDDELISFDKTETDDDPGAGETQDQLPLQLPHVGPRRVLLKS